MTGPAVIGPHGRKRPPRPLLRALLGAVLRRTRREQGRTLADVAAAAKVSMPYLSELERGRKEASSEILAAICDALRIDLADVLTQAGRQLSADQASRAAVIRLTGIDGGQDSPDLRAVPPGLRRPPDAQALLAA